MAPGSTPVAWKAFAKPSRATSKVSAAAAFEKGAPAALKFRLPLVLVTVPTAAVAGRSRVTLNWHMAPGARLPPAKATVPVPVRVEPAPHTFDAGSPVATRPVRAALKSSVKPTSEIGSGELLVIVYWSTTDWSRSTGVDWKAFARVASTVAGAVIVRESVAGLATVRPAEVRSVVVLGKEPTVAVNGTWRVTVKVQVSVPPRVPAVKRRVPVPLIDEPEPQMSFWGNPVATRPGMTALRSSEKASWPTGAAPGFSISNRRSTVCPGSGLDWNAFEKVSERTCRSAVPALPLTPPALARPVGWLVTFE